MCYGHLHHLTESHVNSADKHNGSRQCSKFQPLPLPPTHWHNARPRTRHTPHDPRFLVDQLLMIGLCSFLCIWQATGCSPNHDRFPLMYLISMYFSLVVPQSEYHLGPALCPSAPPSQFTPSCSSLLVHSFELDNTLQLTAKLIGKLLSTECYSKSLP